MHGYVAELRGRESLQVKPSHAIRAAIGLLAAGITGAELVLAGVLTDGCAGSLDQIDPVTYVDGESCPDATGHPQPLIAGYQCCAWHDMGPGQCPEGTSCMNETDCSTPLPDNDSTGAFMARKPIRRTGL